MAKGGEFVLPSDKLPDIFTVNDLTDEQKMIRETVREFVNKEIISEEAIKNIESKNFVFSRKLLSRLGELGILGAEVPEEYEGQGLDKITGAIIAEEIAREGSFATTFLAHTGIGTMPIRFFGTEEQKKKYLPKLVSGEWVAAYSLTEGTAGSDAGSVKTRALWSEGNTYTLSGEKIFVTNVSFADVYIVFAQLEDLGLTAFIIPREAGGLVVGKEEHKMGIQGSSTATLTLNNLRIPRSNLLGEEGKGFKIALNILNLGRFKLGAACLGAGKMCLEESLKYAQERKQFGLPIIKFGAIRQKLAMMAANNYAMESVVYRTAGHLEEAIGKVDSNDPKAVLKAIEEFVVECSIVKVMCSEALHSAVSDNVQVHGGSGFCEGAPERHYRDSRINLIFEGTNEINRMVAVGMLLKNPEIVMKMGVAGKKIIGESMSSSKSEPDDLIVRLNGYLEGARKSFLVVCDAVNEKYKPVLDEGRELMKHQIVIMALADCLIEIYKLESVLGSAQKNRNELSENIVRLIFNDSLFKFDQLTKELLAICSEGDDQRTRLAMLKRFIKFTVENKENLINVVVNHLVKRGC
jgi:alkylation response protein AidB-like acyl-CoA dehydrogenase